MWKMLLKTGGLYRALVCQVVHGKAHFTSWHAKVGLAVFVLSIVAPLGGVVSFRRLGLLQRLPERMQPQIKWAHRNVSTAACYEAEPSYTGTTLRRLACH